MSQNQITPFSTIYDSFFAHITDDMYMELTELDTYLILQELLLNAIPRFEFPRFNIFDYEEGVLMEDTYQGLESDGSADRDGTGLRVEEEINILALNMVIEWLGQQLESTENTRMKYSGSDFKFTSQANHMAKIKVLIDAKKTDCLHLQRLYKRRKVSGSNIQSTLGQIISTPEYGSSDETLNSAAGFWSIGSDT